MFNGKLGHLTRMSLPLGTLFSSWPVEYHPTSVIKRPTFLIWGFAPWLSPWFQSITSVLSTLILYPDILPKLSALAIRLGIAVCGFVVYTTTLSAYSASLNLEPQRLVICLLITSLLWAQWANLYNSLLISRVANPSTSTLHGDKLGLSLTAVWTSSLFLGL